MTKHDYIEGYKFSGVKNRLENIAKNSGCNLAITRNDKSLFKVGYAFDYIGEVTSILEFEKQISPYLA